ncbi:GNAT family N-acetyltransferase [Novosphingobium sp. PS1R-30]|uniref:GNAT family N-acetyltransferase n=1 Tax=Novosphingobium anseongense TaxID=3133436 RepID=A0ABU8RRJ9_9SPHN
MASKAGSLPKPATRPDAAAVRQPAFVLDAVPWRSLADEIVAWDALAVCAAEPNPFFESWYLLPALAAFDPQGGIVILRFEVDGELAGLLPLARPRRYYGKPLPHLATWLHANCFLGAPLVAAGLERHFWRAVLTWADRQAGLGLFLHLAHMPLAGALHEALVEVLAEQRRDAHLVHREERALLCSRDTPEAYFEATLSGKKRKELRRQFARLSELGEVTIERRDDAEGLALWIEHFLALEQAGWKGLAGSALATAPGSAQLFRDSLPGAAARGRLERLTLSLDGAPIAMLATFLASPGAFSFKTAFDERYARFSPGVLLQRENLAILDRTDIAWSDSCAAADHPMIDHIWRERRAIGRLSIAIGGRARRAAFALVALAELGRNPTGLDG